MQPIDWEEGHQIIVQGQPLKRVFIHECVTLSISALTYGQDSSL